VTVSTRKLDTGRDITLIGLGSRPVDGVVKDLGPILDAGAPAGFPDALLPAVHEVFRQAGEAGHGEQHVAAVAFSFAAKG
jgi:3-hydroxyisobutyrate dehydrogenase-like beta-hydroxyacid dehydrogenase